MADSEIEKAVRRIFNEYTEAVEDRARELATNLFWRERGDESEAEQARFTHNVIAIAGDMAKEQLDTVFHKTTDPEADIDSKTTYVKKCASDGCVTKIHSLDKYCPLCSRTILR